MIFLILFIILFIFIISFILYNVHVKATTTYTETSTDMPLYPSAPVFTNTFYNDLALSPPDTEDLNKIFNLPPRHHRRGRRRTPPLPAPAPAATATAQDYYFKDGADPQDAQVYHIFNNIYTFDEAGKECAKRGGRLATKSQLTDAYKQGAGWCSWGWTANGHAYMPNRDTQCNKQKGVLDGSNIDSALRLGVNCFGVPRTPPPGAAATPPPPPPPPFTKITRSTLPPPPPPALPVKVI